MYEDSIYEHYTSIVPTWPYNRIDGPAVTYKNGVVEWWINGYEVTYKIVSWAHENDIDLNNLSDDDKVLIKLTWGDYRG